MNNIYSVNFLFVGKAILYGAIAGGAALLILIIIIIVVVCVMRRRRRRDGSKNNDIGWFIVFVICEKNIIAKSISIYICCFYTHDRYEVNVIK